MSSHCAARQPGSIRGLSGSGGLVRAPTNAQAQASRLLDDMLRSLFAVNSSGNAHVVGRMLKQENIDDLRIGSDGLVGDLDDVTDQLRLARLREAGCDVALDIGHDLPPILLQTGDQILVVGIALDEFRQVLPVLHEVDASTFPDDEKDIVYSFPRRLADDAQQSG